MGVDADAVTPTNVTGARWGEKGAGDWPVLRGKTERLEFVRSQTKLLSFHFDTVSLIAMMREELAAKTLR